MSRLLKHRIENEYDRAYQMGYWSALMMTLGGIVYFLVILGLILTRQFTFPPSDAVQLFGGIITLLYCPVIVILIASLHIVTVPEKRVFSQGRLAFTSLFAIAVSINRFTQLGAVRQSIASGMVEGVDWFLPYGDHSVMFGFSPQVRILFIATTLLVGAFSLAALIFAMRVGPRRDGRLFNRNIFTAIAVVNVVYAISMGPLGL